MKLIVGLGNPGKEYSNTRHNIGFMAIDFFLGNVNWKKKFDSLVLEIEHNGSKIIFIKPQTYINLSGQAVSKFLNFYKINIRDMLVIHDDLDLEVGKFKIKTNSSSGGHNGIKSIINAINTQEFNRLKIGVSKNKQISAKDYVLGKFSKKELETIELTLKTTSRIVDLFLDNDINVVMNKIGIEKITEEEK